MEVYKLEIIIIIFVLMFIGAFILFYNSPYNVKASPINEKSLYRIEAICLDGHIYYISTFNASVALVPKFTDKGMPFKCGK